MDRYCLVSFEADADKLPSLYWPDAYEEHGDYKGPAAGFVAFAPILRERVSTVASLSYRDIAFTSPTEATAMGFGQIVVVSGSPSETKTALVATRYKDLLTKRDGEWRIVRREAGMIAKREI